MWAGRTARPGRTGWRRPWRRAPCLAARARASRPDRRPQPESIRARAMPCSSMGEKLPLVTRPDGGAVRPGRSIPRGAAGGPRWPGRRAGGRRPWSRSAARAARPRKSPLSQPDDPSEPGLQRRDARAELVAVERQGRFEPEGVACPEPGRHHARGGERLPQGRGDVVGHRHLEAVLPGVAGSGGDAPGTLPGEAPDTEAGHVGGLGDDRGRPAPGLGALDGDDRAVGRGVPATDGRHHAVGVGGVGHDVEDVLVHPPDDDVVDDRRVGLVEEVGVLRPAWGDLVAGRW